MRVTGVFRISKSGQRPHVAQALPDLEFEMFGCRKPVISVIIPCFNEEGTTAALSEIAPTANPEVSIGAHFALPRAFCWALEVNPTNIAWLNRYRSNPILNFSFCSGERSGPGIFHKAPDTSKTETNGFGRCSGICRVSASAVC